MCVARARIARARHAAAFAYSTYNPRLRSAILGAGRADFGRPKKNRFGSGWESAGTHADLSRHACRRARRVGLWVNGGAGLPPAGVGMVRGALDGPPVAFDAPSGPSSPRGRPFLSPLLSGLENDQLACGHGESLWSSPSPSAGLRVCLPRAGKNFKPGDDVIF